MPEGKHLYEFGPFRLDPTERLLLRNNQTVPLAPKAFDTLLLLVENSGHLLTKDELMQRLWPGTFVEEVNLAQNISIIRRALKEAGDAEELIETVPKGGYRFNGIVQTVSPTNVVEGEKSPSKRGIRRVTTLALALAAAIVVSAGIIGDGGSGQIFGN